MCRNLARIGTTNHNLTICSLPLGYYEIVISGAHPTRRAVKPGTDVLM